MNLVGCVGYGPNNQFIGLDRKEIVQRLGEPTDELKSSAGAVLEYARGPYGRHSYRIGLDSAGKVTQWEQILIDSNFKKIRPAMTQAEVRALIGRSYEISGLARNRGEVWSYRYETPSCVWFQVEFTADGLVRSAGDGIPPECLRPND